jgi:hypothetical protein
MSDKHDDHGHSHDDGHGHEEGGGHEIDRMPNARLFNLLFGLSALTLVAGIGVVQLFNIQVEALEDSRAQQGSFRLAGYIEEMQQTKTGSGKFEVSELDDKATVNTRYYMPLANARKAVLDDPARLKAFGKYPGWKSADDQAPTAPPPAAPVPTEPVPAGAGQAPAPGGAAAPVPAPPPTDGAKPAAPTDGAKPAAPTDGAKPAEVAKPGEPAKVEGEKPAEDAKAEPDAKAPKKPAPPADAPNP